MGYLFLVPEISNQNFAMVKFGNYSIICGAADLQIDALKL
jgi:hypothetical protein